MIKKLMMFVVAAMAAIGAWAEVYYDWYSNDDGNNTITLSGVYVDGVMPNPLVIPSEYDGRTVTRITSLEESDITKAKSIVLPNSLLAIEANIFVDCMQLEKVDVVPGGKYKTRDNMLLSVDEKELVAFYGKASFSRTSLAIPDTVEIMGWWALFNSEKLKSVEIPKNVREIKGNPFIRCYALENISLHPANSAYKIENELLLTKDGKKLIATAGSYTKKRRDIVVPEGVDEICEASLTSDMVDIRNVWMPKTLKVLHDALEWGGHGGKNGEYGAMENVVFQTQEKFEIAAGACLFCDCDINNVWFAGPVPENFYSGCSSEGWWECGNVRKIHYTAEYKDEWEEALRNIGYANRGYVNRLEEFPKPPNSVSANDGSVTVSVVVFDDCKDMGTVTGGKMAKAGTKVTLKATANKGYVFAGWFEYNEESDEYVHCDSSEKDYRNPSYAYTVGEDDKTFYAMFMPAEDDDALMLLVNDGTEDIWIDPDEEELKTFTVEGEQYLELTVRSASLPKVTVKGLPAGMKFTDKPVYKKGSKTEIEYPANTIYGAPTKPGVYKVSVSLTNASIKKAIVCEFEIFVPNFVSEVFPGLSPKPDVYSFETGVGIDLGSINCAASSDDWKVTVSGLPAGLKWDAKEQGIVGVPTKPGVYTVTFTAKRGKETEVATITMNIEALPTAAYGSFNGFVTRGDGLFNKVGSFQMTVSDVGKISAKVVTAAGSYSYSATGWTVFGWTLYTVDMQSKKGDRVLLYLYLSPDTGWNGDQITGWFFDAEGNEYNISAQKTVFGEPWYFKAKSNDGYWSLIRTWDKKAADITVTVKDGTTKLAGKIDGMSVNSSGFVNMSDFAAGCMKASFTPVVTVNKVKKVLVVDAELWFDSSVIECGMAGFNE